MGGIIANGLLFLTQFAVDPAAFEQRHELANDPWEKGLMTAEQYLLQTVFYEPRPFTPAAFLQAMKERSRIAAPRSDANPSRACGIRGGGVGDA